MNMLGMHVMVVYNLTTLLLILISATAQPALARSDIAGPVEARVERVVDGDTVRVAAKIWVDQYVSVSVRLLGVDAPEIFRPRCEAERAQGHKAKAFVEAMISGGAVILRDIDHDKYGGRVDARVETADGADVAGELLAAGLAVAEGDDDPWCD
jgi:endonuclease YncB( thermonuclease family)